VQCSVELWCRLFYISYVYYVCSILTLSHYTHLLTYYPTHTHTHTPHIHTGNMVPLGAAQDTLNSGVDAAQAALEKGKMEAVKMLRELFQEIPDPVITMICLFVSWVNKEKDPKRFETELKNLCKNLLDIPDSISSNVIAFVVRVSVSSVSLSNGQSGYSAHSMEVFYFSVCVLFSALNHRTAPLSTAWLPWCHYTRSLCSKQ
jgi:hypothetical protein